MCARATVKGSSILCIYSSCKDRSRLLPAIQLPEPVFDLCLTYRWKPKFLVHPGFLRLSKSRYIPRTVLQIAEQVLGPFSTNIAHPVICRANRSVNEARESPRTPTKPALSQMPPPSKPSLPDRRTRPNKCPRLVHLQAAAAEEPQQAASTLPV